jgi:hypothetical protein
MEEKNKTKSRKKSEMVLSWREYLAIIALIVAIVGGIPGLISTWDYFINKPVLVVFDFDKNDTLHFYIHNEGDKTALIKKFDLCFFNTSNSSICFEGKVPAGVEFGKPKEIPPDRYIIVNTTFDIPIIKKLFIHPSNRWGVKICEETTGCKVHEFHGDPSKKTIFAPYIPVITPNETETITISFKLIGGNETKNI